MQPPLAPRHRHGFGLPMLSRLRKFKRVASKMFKRVFGVKRREEPEVCDGPVAAALEAAAVVRSQEGRRRWGCIPVFSQKISRREAIAMLMQLNAANEQRFEERFEERFQERFEERFQERFEERFQERFEERFQERFQERFEEHFRERFEERFQARFEERFQKFQERFEARMQGLALRGNAGVDASTQWEDVPNEVDSQQQASCSDTASSVVLPAQPVPPSRKEKFCNLRQQYKKDIRDVPRPQQRRWGSCSNLDEC